MTRNRHRNNSIQTTIKDYFVPIIGGVLILILLYNIFSGDSNTQESINESENRIATEVRFDSVDTQATVVYPGDIREEISDSYSFYKGERIIVQEGSVILNAPDGNKIHLNKIAELKYEEDGSYALYSSDAWFTLANDTNISMSYANISAPAGSIIAVTQNEANSTIYVLAGSAKVTNLAGVNTLLIKGQKLSVSRQNAANGEADLANEKGNIDSYFKGSDWFIENKGHIILEQNSTSGTGSTSEETSQGSSGTFISFDNLSDEMSTESSSLNITGEVLSEEVGSVTINNSQVSISGDNSFQIDNVTLRNTVNDLVVKIYSNNKDILEKKVYTVYTNSRTNSVTPSSPASAGSTTYEVDATKFGFTEPSATGKFSTTSSEITIRGFTQAEGISKVQVNGFTLSSFNGNTWRYHAFERFETLEEGTNQYRVDYFGEGGNIVYTDYYTIVKKTAETSAQVPATETTDTSENIISSEANPQ